MLNISISKGKKILCSDYGNCIFCQPDMGGCDLDCVEENGHKYIIEKDSITYIPPNNY